MLSETIKNMIIEKMELTEAPSYWRSKQQFHDEMIRNAKATAALDQKLQHAKANSTTAHIRTSQQKLDQAYKDSDDLVDAANHHHGAGVGDAIRDHAHMTLEPTSTNPKTGEAIDTYNLPHHAKFRQDHGIKDDPRLVSRAIVQPNKPTVKSKPAQKTVKKPTLLSKLLKNTATGLILNKIAPKLMVKDSPK